MASRIKTGDLIKIISGANKGKIAKATQVLPAKNQVLLEGIGERTRHQKRSLYNPNGGKKKIQVPVALSKVALVHDEKAAKTSRVGFKIDSEGQKQRIARQANDKLITDQIKKPKKGAK